ncbi:hypothetical protein HK100_005704, partial [Physocladia obscura]
MFIAIITSVIFALASNAAPVIQERQDGVFLTSLGCETDEFGRESYEVKVVTLPLECSVYDIFSIFSTQAWGGQNCWGPGS